jgi:hypothetical protein
MPKHEYLDFTKTPMSEAQKKDVWKRMAKDPEMKHWLTAAHKRSKKK